MAMKGAAHRADATALLDNRGYSGHLIRGQVPYLLIEEAVRNRITESYYWKEQCFGLNAATLLDRAAELTCIGGTFNDGQRPTPFLCLAFKMLQLGVEDEILEVYLREGGETFKYLRALAAFYIRLTRDRSETVYSMLEPFLSDYRKLRRRGNNGYRLTTIDEFVDELLTNERVCATSLWKLVPREQLEDEEKLEERVSPVQHMLDEQDEQAENGDRDEVMDAASDLETNQRSNSNHTPNGRPRSHSERTGSESDASV